MILVQDKITLIGAVNVVIDSEQGSAHSSSISKDLELSVTDVSDQRDFMGNHVISTKVLNRLDKMSRVSMHTNPNTINKDFGGVWRAERLIFLENFHISLDHELNDWIAGSTNSDIAHKSQVFHETASLSFRGLGRANQSPMSVVQLARFGNFSVTSNRSICAT
jgi:hypothetical protein